MSFPPRPQTTRAGLRADQVAGGVFIALGIAVFIIGWDLPFGRLSAPGAGMLPKMMAGLMIVLSAGILIAGNNREQLRDIPWGDWTHAALILVISAVAVSLYAKLGFLIAMSLLVFALLTLVERKHVLMAAAYAVSLTGFAYWLFAIVLKAQLERGLLWF